MRWATKWSLTKYWPWLGFQAGLQTSPPARHLLAISHLSTKNTGEPRKAWNCGSGGVRASGMLLAHGPRELLRSQEGRERARIWANQGRASSGHGCEGWLHWSTQMFTAKSRALRAPRSAERMLRVAVVATATSDVIAGRQHPVACPMVMPANSAATRRWRFESPQNFRLRRANSHERRGPAVQTVKASFVAAVAQRFAKALRAAEPMALRSDGETIAARMFGGDRRWHGAALATNP